MWKTQDRFWAQISPFTHILPSKTPEIHYGARELALFRKPQLQLPLASWAVRKLAHPRAPELALGAIAPGGVLIWDEANARAYGLDALQRQRIETEQRREPERRQQLYGDPPLAALRHRPLLVVDDGVATGLTVRAALESLRQAEPTPWCWPCR